MPAARWRFALVKWDFREAFMFLMGWFHWYLRNSERRISENFRFLFAAKFWAGEMTSEGGSPATPGDRRLAGTRPFRTAATWRPAERVVGRAPRRQDRFATGLITLAPGSQRSSRSVGRRGAAPRTDAASDRRRL